MTHLSSGKSTNFDDLGPQHSKYMHDPDIKMLNDTITEKPQLLSIACQSQKMGVLNLVGYYM